MAVNEQFEFKSWVVERSNAGELLRAYQIFN